MVTSPVPITTAVREAELVPVTSGLVYNVDAGNVSSYAGNGSLWVDLAGNYNTTLVGGTSFDAGIVPGGTIDFDGAASGATAGLLYDNITAGSIEMWVRPTSLPATGAAIYQYPTLFNKGDVFAGMSIKDDYTVLIYAYGPSYQTVTSTGTAALNQWTSITYTWDATGSDIYINGALDIHGSASWDDINYTSAWQGDTARIGHNFQNGTDNFAGQIPIVRGYNRVLTSGEVSTNFEALRTRFGI